MEDTIQKRPCPEMLEVVTVAGSCSRRTATCISVLAVLRFCWVASCKDSFECTLDGACRLWMRCLEVEA